MAPDINPLYFFPLRFFHTRTGPDGDTDDGDTTGVLRGKGELLSPVLMTDAFEEFVTVMTVMVPF